MALVNSALIIDGKKIGGSDGSGNANLVKACYDETTALYPHAVNDIVYVNEHFYKVTSAIAVNDTIAVGVNVTATTGISADTQVYVDNIPASGGSGGSSTFAGLSDVDITGITNGQGVVYDSTTHKMIPATIATDEQMFNLLYSLKNVVTNFQSNGNVVETFYSDNTLTTSVAVATTVFTDSNHINTTIVPTTGSYNYTKSTVFSSDGNTVTETYSKVAKE